MITRNTIIIFALCALQLALVSGEPTPSHYVYSTPNIFPYSPYYHNLQRSYYLPNRLDPNTYSFTQVSSPTSGSFIQKLVLLPSADPKPADATCGTCGLNAHCAVIGGRPVCACLRGYFGDAVSVCHRVECLDHSDCGGHLSCVNSICVDPCEGKCGFGAECKVNNHIPVCSCLSGFTGNPDIQCTRSNPCDPHPCGPNTRCEVNNNIASCKCLPGYYGNGLQGCRHECDSDHDCGSSLACIEFKCQNPCRECAANAVCRVTNHAAICECPKNYLGNPKVSCQPECVHNSDCPGNKPTCFYNKCVNPCVNACGANANCDVRGGTAYCSCPKHLTGDPYTLCRPFEKREICEPNPCGTNAKCTPGHDHTGAERPVCTCPEGYTGNALSHCHPAECTMDDHCPDNKACNNYNCVNPCHGQCGAGGICTPKRHVAVCTCQEGYVGDALNNCYETKHDTARSGRYYNRRFYYNYYK